MFQFLPGSVLAYGNEDCQDHQFLLLKHQDHFLVTVSCKTLNIALKLLKFTKKGPSKSALPSDILQQKIKIKNIVDSLELTYTYK